MKKIVLFILLFSCFLGFSQEDAWVYFNTKNTQSYFDAPLHMLSQRALDRRTKQRILLDLKDIPINPAFISQVKAVPGITVMARSKWMNALHIRGTQTIINSLEGLSFVEGIDFANKSLNQMAKKPSIAKNQPVNKTLENQINFPYGNSANQIQQLKGHLLHQQNYTGSGKIIAIMDAGFPGVNTASPFQRLRDNSQILGGYDYVNRNNNFYLGNSHGTMVLSSMGGYQDNTLVGTAPDASYYLFITENNNSENPIEESLWVEAAEKADSLGVDIINTSLGYFNFDNPTYNHTYSEMDGNTAFMTRGAEIAVSRGMIVVVSAGNEGATANPHIAVPADGASVLTVGAVNASGLVTSFSSIGPSFDGRVKPDVMAQGQASVLSNSLGTIGTASGTSFSSPIMAGMVACLWQAHPNKTNKEIKDLIVKSADRFLVPTTQYGYGIPDFSLALANGLEVNDLLEENDIVIYPNPIADYLTIYPPDFTHPVSIRIYSITGQLVLKNKKESQSSRISLQSLRSGIYFYEIERNGSVKNGKIIKQ